LQTKRLQPLTASLQVAPELHHRGVAIQSPGRSDMRGIIATTSALLLMLIPASPAAAQTTDAGPARGVARLSLINGDVTTKRGDSGDWVAAQVNEPVVEGDFIETGPGSRVEVQLDHSNVVRLDGSTSVEMTELGNRVFRVRL